MTSDVRLSPTPVDASADDTWRAIASIVQRGGFPIAVIDRSSGIVQTSIFQSEATRLKDYFDCGTFMGRKIVNLGSFTVNQRLNIQMSESGGRVAVVAHLTGRAYEPKAGWVDCASLGVWEAQFAEAVRAGAHRQDER
jgi:hypothetical protein